MLAFVLTIKAASLSIEASISSAEVHAINMTLDIVSMKAENRIVIFSDSLSVAKSFHVNCYLR